MAILGSRFKAVLDILVDRSCITKENLLEVSRSSAPNAMAVRLTLRRGPKLLHDLLTATAREAARLAMYQQYNLECELERRVYLINWLLQQAGPDQQVFESTSTGYARWTSELLRIPNMPLSIATTLVTLGFRVTYQQLLSAARCGVPGLEVWVKAFKQLPVALRAPLPEGMPHEVGSLLCEPEHPPVSLLAQQTMGEALPDILALVLTMSRTPQATNLLHTLVELPVTEELDPGAVADLMTIALKAHVSERVLELIRLPAAQELSLELLLKLLETALNNKLATSVRALCGLPSANQLTAAHIVVLMQLAVQLEGSGGVRVLCSLPAAQALEGAVVYDLIAVAITDHKKVAAICSLSASVQVTAVHVATLMQLALQAGCAMSLEPLGGLPAAQWLPALQVLALVDYAIKSASAAAVVELWKLPAARSTKWEAVKVMLQATDPWGDGTATFSPAEVLATLLAGYPAGPLSTAAVAWGLLEAAAATRTCQCPATLAALVSTLDAALELGCINANVIAQLLSIAVQLGDRYQAAVGALSSIPAAGDIPAPELYKLLKAAVTGADARATASNTAALCRLPAAQQLSALQVYQLLELVLQRTYLPAANTCDWALPIEDLCKLAAAQELSSNQVAGLLKAAILCTEAKIGDCSFRCALQKLFGLPAAGKLGTQKLLHLCKTAFIQRCFKVLQYLPVWRLARQQRLGLLNEFLSTAACGSRLVDLCRESGGAQWLIKILEAIGSTADAVTILQHLAHCKCPVEKWGTALPVIQAVLELPAAKQLDSGTLLSLLDAALKNSNFHIAVQLLQLSVLSEVPNKQQTLINALLSVLKGCSQEVFAAEEGHGVHDSKLSLGPAIMLNGSVTARRDAVLRVASPLSKALEQLEPTAACELLQAYLDDAVSCSGHHVWTPLLGLIIRLPAIESLTGAQYMTAVQSVQQIWQHKKEIELKHCLTAFCWDDIGVYAYVQAAALYTDNLRHYGSDEALLEKMQRSIEIRSFDCMNVIQQLLGLPAAKCLKSTDQRRMLFGIKSAKKHANKLIDQWKLLQSRATSAIIKSVTSNMDCMMLVDVMLNKAKHQLANLAAIEEVLSRKKKK